MERLRLNERYVIRRRRTFCLNLYWNNGLALSDKYLVGIQTKSIDLDSGSFQSWGGGYSHESCVRAGLLGDSVFQHARMKSRRHVSTIHG